MPVSIRRRKPSISTNQALAPMSESGLRLTTRMGDYCLWESPKKNKKSFEHLRKRRVIYISLGQRAGWVFGFPIELCFRGQGLVSLVVGGRTLQWRPPFFYGELVCIRAAVFKINS